MKNNTKFFTCYQNNSCGYFIQNDDVDLFVCVEAKNVSSAKNKFKHILKNYREYCPCCGYRWSDSFLAEQNGYNVPTIFGEDYSKYSDKFFCRSGSIIIYYLNGTKVKHCLLKNLKEFNYEKNI